MRSFNTEGPIVSEDHYSVPPLGRMNLDSVLELIRNQKYFSLHAPRQSGKTTALLTLQDLLNSGSAGPYRCVYINVESAQAMREDIPEAMRTILDELSLRALSSLNDDSLEEICADALALSRPGLVLRRVLFRWARADPRPLVLLIDEIDSLVGATLVSTLRQLRAGYDLRPKNFPQSVVLCGVRDLRNYRFELESEDDGLPGGSAFNIAADSLRLGDFSEQEVRQLLGQHTAETGQEFSLESLKRVWTQTCGQPWLVNALCKRACFRSVRGRDRDRPITENDILEAQEELVLERVVHLDQLADKLREDCVRRVIEPLLSGGSLDNASARDYENVRDLGLIAADDPIRIANPIYTEVEVRELTFMMQKSLIQETAWYLDSQNGLDMTALMSGFQAFFRQHSEPWLAKQHYQEVGPQLLLQAFLQRVVDGGGRIERGYALGRGRTDLLVLWPQGERMQRFVVECKILRGSLENSLKKGLAQTAGYMDRCAAEEGHLVIFDREKKTWQDAGFHRSETCNGLPIEVWGM